MASQSPKRILVVDDEEEALGHLKSILEHAHFEVSAATNGKDALELARSILPDLIVMDIVMPGIEGGDVASVLSEDPATQDIPIIFLTGILTKEEQLLGKKTGKYRVIAKPIAARELLGLIVQALSGS
ncbi:MAG: response regulator [Candidatus Omnitrophota bacterium]